METERYSRQIMLPEIGEEGQKKLSRAKVLIVGLGGLGAPVATYLTGAGIGTLMLADSDVVSMSNLQRQLLYNESQIGKPKTESARERLYSMSSHTRFELYTEGFTTKNCEALMSEADVVIDCCDNYATRYLINDACTQCDKPWIYGSIGEFLGQVSVFNYTEKRQYTELYPDREYLCGLPRTTLGVIGVVPGIIGCIQAAEAIKFLTGTGELLTNRLLRFDTLTMQFTTIALAPSPYCPNHSGRDW
ncbi:MAG: HesA/MoeB/ThiF family protein [Muribaculaceae bacterium]|nr:HesA/MoeB/ThiF family protein [Muribaculaceae bacterium]